MLGEISITIEATYYKRGDMDIFSPDHSMSLRPGMSYIQHLVKSEDLNHHRTLYAGRVSEWFVEAGFVAAASLASPDQTVCLKIHGLEFKRPVRVGEIANFHGRVAYAGRSSLIVFVRVTVMDEPVVEGFLTFIHVDDNGRPIPHGVELSPRTEEERMLYEEARNVARARKG